MASDLKLNFARVREDIPTHVKLVAVSKFHGKESVMQVYEAGQRVFGENRVQELDSKREGLPLDIEWHLIGHLQTNKVKTIVPYIHTIQSVDSWKLLEEINKQATRVGRVINCLLEIHIAQEDSKYGFSFDSCRDMLNKQDWKLLSHVKITGVMGMATNTDDENLVRSEFKSLKAFFDELKTVYFKDRSEFCEVSMGMSQDSKIAIEEGSTIVRVGTSIFGEREY